MEWIKRNPHYLVLAILSVALLAVSAIVILSARSFPEKFAKIATHPVPSDRLPPLAMEPLEKAEQSLKSPSAWVAPGKGYELLIPARYVVQEGGTLKKSEEAAFYSDSLSKRSIPNDWFLKNGLSLTDPKVVTEDPDKDAFTNADEWRAGTDPNNKDSHPAYHSKLFLSQFIRVPFRLLFQAVDGDPKKPEAFQINAVDRGKRTEFLKIGEKVSGSPYQLKSYEYKVTMNPNTQVEEDVSELTFLNTETQESVVVPLAKVTDSPDSYALFAYEWPDSAKPQMIKVKKLQAFVLAPNKDPKKDLYKLLDIKETEAVIQTPTGEKVTISRDPRL